MKEKIEKRLNDRGQVGIGTLIVFIAMVLVAAIAAGVLINTAGFLQTKSEQTGQESSAQVSNRVQVVSGFGNVANSEEVNYINLTAMRGSGADDINLSTATIEWIGPNEAKTLTSGVQAEADGWDGVAETEVDGETQEVPYIDLDGDGEYDSGEEKGTVSDGDVDEDTVEDYLSGNSNEFSVGEIKDNDGSVPVLNSQDDRFRVSMNATAIGGDRLGEGQTVELKLTTQYGAVTIYRANMPQSLSQESAVSV